MIVQTGMVERLYLWQSFTAVDHRGHSDFFLRLVLFNPYHGGLAAHPLTAELPKFWWHHEHDLQFGVRFELGLGEKEEAAGADVLEFHLGALGTAETRAGGKLPWHPRHRSLFLFWLGHESPQAAVRNQHNRGRDRDFVLFSRGRVYTGRETSLENTGLVLNSEQDRLIRGL